MTFLSMVDLWALLTASINSRVKLMLLKHRTCSGAFLSPARTPTLEYSAAQPNQPQNIDRLILTT